MNRDIKSEAIQQLCDLLIGKLSEYIEDGRFSFMGNLARERTYVLQNKLTLFAGIIENSDAIDDELRHNLLNAFLGILTEVNIISHGLSDVNKFKKDKSANKASQAKSLNLKDRNIEILRLARIEFNKNKRNTVSSVAANILEEVNKWIDEKYDQKEIKLMTKDAIRYVLSKDENQKFLKD